MTHPIYPNNLPYEPDRDSWKLRAFDKPLRSDFEQGPARVRRRFTRTPARLEQRVTMSLANYSLFLSFIKYELDYASLWFFLDVWTGARYEARLVRFMDGTPEVTMRGTSHVSVPMSLEVLDIDVQELTTAFFGSPPYDYYLNIGYLGLDKAVNVDWPGIT